MHFGECHSQLLLFCEYVFVPVKFPVIGLYNLVTSVFCNNILFAICTNTFSKLCKHLNSDMWKSAQQCSSVTGRY
jgi:hypothetical protein